MPEACDAAGVALVPLVAPTSPDERLAQIGARARGFLYTVSVDRHDRRAPAGRDAFAPILGARQACTPGAGRAGLRDRHAGAGGRGGRRRAPTASSSARASCAPPRRPTTRRAARPASSLRELCRRAHPLGWRARHGPRLRHHRRPRRLDRPLGDRLEGLRRVHDHDRDHHARRHGPDPRCRTCRAARDVAAQDGRCRRGPPGRRRRRRPRRYSCSASPWPARAAATTDEDETSNGTETLTIYSSLPLRGADRAAGAGHGQRDQARARGGGRQGRRVRRSPRLARLRATSRAAGTASRCSTTPARRCATSTRSPTSATSTRPPPRCRCRCSTRRACCRSARRARTSGSRGPSRAQGRARALLPVRPSARSGASCPPTTCRPPRWSATCRTRACARSRCSPTASSTAAGSPTSGREGRRSGRASRSSTEADRRRRRTTSSGLARKVAASGADAFLFAARRTPARPRSSTPSRAAPSMRCSARRPWPTQALRRRALPAAVAAAHAHHDAGARRRGCCPPAARAFRAAFRATFGRAARARGAAAYEAMQRGAATSIRPRGVEGQRPRRGHPGVLRDPRPRRRCSARYSIDAQRRHEPESIRRSARPRRAARVRAQAAQGPR